MSVNRPENIALTDVYRLAPQARLKHDAVREADFLLLPERAVKLNDSAVAILKRIDGARDIQSIVSELEMSISAPNVEEMQNDVLNFVADFVSKGWLKRI